MHPLANALIVVDVQNDFCPGGSLAVDHGDEVASRIRTFVEEHTDEYKTIVATKDWHPGDIPFDHFSFSPDFADTWPVHCVQNTDGAKFHPNLHADELCFDRIFYKGQESAAYSGFEGTDSEGQIDLNMYLKVWNIGHVDVVGLATDYCVKATALDAVHNGYDTSVLTTMCAGVNRDTTIGAIEEMLRSGVHVDGWWG